MSDYGHDEAMCDIFDLAHIETEFEGSDPRVTNLAAHIESLEKQRDWLAARLGLMGMPDALPNEFTLNAEGERNAAMWIRAAEEATRE